MDLQYLFHSVELDSVLAGLACLDWMQSWPEKLALVLFVSQTDLSVGVLMVLVEAPMVPGLKRPRCRSISCCKVSVNDDVTFKFNFSEDVVGFNASDINVSGGSKGKFSGSGDSYQLVVSPNSNDEGTITIKTNAGNIFCSIG